MTILTHEGCAEKRLCVSFGLRMNNSSRPRIYIDFDDVLCETALGFTDIIRESFGRHVAFEDIHSFNLWESFDLTQTEYDRLMDLGHRDDFLSSLAPIPGARDVILDWTTSGLEVTIVTGRPPACAPVSADWLKRHDIPVAGIVFVDKYGRNHANDCSITPHALGQMNFALAIEDAPAMAQHILSHTSFPLVVYDRPWNRNFPTGHFPQSGQATRARDWSHIAQNWREWIS